MKLWQTRRHWEKLARTDPMWAVLTAPDKRGNRWDPAEFFRTGQQEVDFVLERIRARYPQLGRGHALDFGSGVGRISQALAAHFDRVTGIDISEKMIGLARDHNRHGARVNYVHNTRPDLAGFGDGTFDLVFSVITLQHIAPEYSRRYIGEFIRVLAPGGAAYFQMPALAHVVPKAEPLRWSTWPPTLMKRLRRIVGRFAWRHYNRIAAAKPVLEMHTLPRAEVEALLARAGAEVLDVQRNNAAGDAFESYVYLARKP